MGRASWIVGAVCVGWMLACAGIGTPVPMAELGADQICECETRDCQSDEWGTWETYKSMNEKAIAGLSPEERREFDAQEARMKRCMGM